MAEKENKVTPIEKVKYEGHVLNPQANSKAFAEFEFRPIARELLERLKTHGEMQVDLASGKTVSFHLGDVGYVTPNGITIRFGNAEIYTLS